MTEYTIHQLERAEKHLARHLEDLNDQIDQDGGRIKDHMDLDGIKDCIKSIHMIHFIPELTNVLQTQSDTDLTTCGVHVASCR